MVKGKVYLVGAGPGAPDLLTIKGLRLLRTADVVAHDRLVDDRIVSLARSDAEVVDVGKIPGSRGRAQANINDLLIDRARRFRRVVRLKGGDPFVFGRGGEEAEALIDAGVPFEVVPGVTSATAAPAYAGIPVTHRDYASTFTVVTGSMASTTDGSAINWESLAKLTGTLVVLMGWRSLHDVVTRLIEGGKPGDTPAAAVSWGTEPWQRTVAGTLRSIVETARAEGLDAPAAVVIGDVVRLRDRLNWFETLPLFGRRVLVTRTTSGAGLLSRRLAELGAQPIEIPTIQIRPLADYSHLDAHLAAIADFDWVAFTSANAVRSVQDRLKAAGKDMRSLHGVRVASIGPATSAVLEKAGIIPDLEPETASSTALASTLEDVGISGTRILLPRADIATSALPERLSDSGATVEETEAYCTVVPASSRSKLRKTVETGIDAATFTSASSVRNLAALLDNDLRSLRKTSIACIGPLTAAAVSDVGLKADIVAATQSIDCLVQDLAEFFANETTR